MKNKMTTFLLFLVFMVGLSLLLYPTVSDYWNSFTQSRAIASYAEEVAAMDSEQYDSLWNNAVEYNSTLINRNNAYLLSDEQAEAYDELLNLSGNGIMGYVEIPSIGCSLPIYHGTAESVLQIAVGHIEWTSLPVGGESTHTVISGHRGLPSAKLFTDLDDLVEGDIFMLRVLDEILTYEVDKISIVDPDDTQNLLISPGMDYCTLVTCTPYGINTHRLLVRGHRIENLEESKSIRITADAIQIDPMIVAPIALVPILFIFMLILLLSDTKPKELGGELYDHNIYEKDE